VSEANKAIVRSFVNDLINHGRMELASKYVWDDVIEHVPLPGQGPGIEGLKDILQAMRTGFPDIDFSIKEQIAEGADVVSRFVWTGTHHGPFLGIPATGKPVSVWGMVIDHIIEGRIKETRIIMDAMGMMMQLGVIPPPT
jgi:steroid delta-isomerase-like uncharacterized protein